MKDVSLTYVMLYFIKGFQQITFKFKMMYTSTTLYQENDRNLVSVTKTNPNKNYEMRNKEKMYSILYEHFSSNSSY